MKTKIRDLFSNATKLRRRRGAYIPFAGRGLRAKQYVPLFILGLAAFIAVSCGGPAGSTAADKPYQPLSCLAPSCEEVTVKSGDVTLSVLAAGSLRYVHNADLRFLSSARVISVDVKVGDVVSEGQVLASLDPSSLELEVTAAMVSVREAVDDLEELLTPPTPEELSAAEATVAEAKLAVAEAQLKLKLAETGATEQELAGARLDWKSAEFTLQEDRKDLEDFIAGPAAQEIAQAHQVQAEAEVALKDAESGLAGLAPDMVQALVLQRQLI